MKDSYESLFYRLKFFRALRAGIATLLVLAVVLVPTLWWMDRGVQARHALRDAKNIVQNIELLSLEYYGFDEQLTDITRVSGLSEPAEQQVMLFSGADGTIRSVGWDSDQHTVLELYYEYQDFIVEYRYHEDGGTYSVFHLIGEYERPQ